MSFLIKKIKLECLDSICVDFCEVIVFTSVCGGLLMLIYFKAPNQLIDVTEKKHFNCECTSLNSMK